MTDDTNGSITEIPDMSEVPYDLSSDDLIFLINKLYPEAVHGTDFWVAHMVERNSATRISPAIIVQWTHTQPKPSYQQIVGLEQSFAIGLAERRLKIHREEYYPNLSPRQLWLMAKDVNVTKQMVLDAIAAMPDRELADRFYIEVTEPPKMGYTRNSPAVNDLSVLMGIPPEQMDYLWRRAYEQYDD